MFHRSLRLIVILFALVGVLPVMGACSYTLSPPASTMLSRPVTVAVVDMGTHSELALPRADGTYRQYYFGEWEWCARANNFAGLRAPLLVVPHGGTLGRLDLASLDAVKAQRAQQVLCVGVEASRASGLLARLDEVFASRIKDEVVNPECGHHFVPTDQRYTLLGSNCNTQVAEWLSELGVSVSGFSPIGSFAMADGAAPAPAVRPAPATVVAASAAPAKPPTLAARPVRRVLSDDVIERREARLP